MVSKIHPSQTNLVSLGIELSAKLNKRCRPGSLISMVKNSIGKYTTNQVLRGLGHMVFYGECIFHNGGT
jgi:hypothetical protein